MTDQPQTSLHLVNSETGEAESSSGNALSYADALLILDRKERELNVMRLENGRLKKELKDQRRDEAAAKDIEEVLGYWRPRCMPKAWIVADSPRWNKVRARLRDVDRLTGATLTVQDCMEAIEGALLSDYHVTNDYLDAETIFRDIKTVEKHRARFLGQTTPSQRRVYRILARLSEDQLAKLLVPCDCGHFMWNHHPANEFSNNVCAKCECIDYSTLDQRIDEWKRSIA